MNIYVGNLPYSTQESDLRALFEKYGKVESASIIIDRRSSRSRGYGFVEMADETEGRAALESLNGYELDGRALRVDEARRGGERRSRAGAPRRSGRGQQRRPTAAAREEEPREGGFLGFLKRLFG